MRFEELFGNIRPVIGLLPLGPLPGSSRYGGSLPALRRQALADAEALVSGGCDALLVENANDDRGHEDRVGPATVAAMALLTAAVVEAVMVPVGVSILRNDAQAAVAVATVAEARFVRVAVHVGKVTTPAGLVEGRAADTLRLRGALQSDVAIFADVPLKQALPAGEAELVRAAHDTYYRGLADALVVSGGRQGLPFDAREAQAIRAALPEAPLLAASGVSPDNAPLTVTQSDGLITGNWCHLDGDPTQPIDSARVRQLVEAIERAI